MFSFQTLLNRVWVAGVLLTLVSCGWYTPVSTQLTVGFAGVHTTEIEQGRLLSRTAISEAYPALKLIELAVSTRSLTTSDINTQFNGGKFTLNAAKTAFVLSDTVVDLVVPNSETLLIEITAFNQAGYKVFSGRAEFSVTDLAKPKVSVAVPIEVDIDDTIPVLNFASSTDTQSSCTDTDGDNLCDVYEDLFLNASGIADIDGDGTLNREDLDSDGDGVDDSYDNKTHDYYSFPTPSNNGYPMFIVANRLPVIADVTVTTSENLATTLSLPAESVDADVNDEVTYVVTASPSNGSVVVNGTDIRYTPDLYFVGTDTFSVEAQDLTFNFTEQATPFRVTVNVVDNPLLVNRAPVAVDEADVQSTPGAHIVLDVLANDSDPDQTVGDTLSIASATSEFGEVRVSRDRTKLFFKSERSNTDATTINYTIQDSFGLTSSTSVLVWMNSDSDGDGLSASVLTNGSSVLDADDANPDVDGDGFSDFFEAFTPVDTADVSGTVVTGQIDVDTAWTIKGSPYVVSGTGIQVASNAELRIEQGVDVKFEAGTSLNITPGSSLFVMGGLSDSLNVRFTSLEDVQRQPVTGATGNPTAGDWDTVLLGSVEMSQIHGAGFHYATKGLLIGDGSPIVDDATFAQAAKSGLSVDTSTGAPSVSDSVFTANAFGVEILSLGADMEITNSVVRDNSTGNALGNGAGLWLAADLTAGVSVTNSLIIRNTATNNGGGVYVGDNSKLTLLGNTIANNVSGAGGNGVYIASGTDTVLATDNIFNYNDDCGDGCVDDIVEGVAGAVNTASDFNVTDAFQGQSSSLPVGNNLFGTYPAFTDGWYLSQVSEPALDAGSFNTATPPAYFSRLTNPTTDSTGTVDSGQVDIGFHHNAPANIASSSTSKIEPLTLEADAVDLPPLIADIIVEPKSLAGVSLGAFADVYMDFSSRLSQADTVLRYIGDGKYKITVTVPPDSCTLPYDETLFFYANGISVGSIFINYAVSGC